MTFAAKLKFLFKRDERNLYTVKEFGHANKDFLIIVCDPKTDRIFVSYRDRFVNGKIKSTDGHKAQVVKNIVKFSRFDTKIDDFLTSIAETLGLSMFKGNQFFQFLDGALYRIASSLRKKRGPVAQTPVKSPYMGADIKK